MSKYQQPRWRTNTNVPSGHAGFDTRKAKVERQEIQRRAEIEAANDKHDQHGHLHHHTDRELHHMGFTVKRNFWGQRVAIIPTEIHGDRMNDKTAAARQRKLDRKEAAKQKAKNALWGDSKKSLFYWK